VSRQHRPTPWDVVFADEKFEQEAFPAIERESSEREIDARSPDRFLLLSSVGSLLHELAPEAPGRQASGEMPPLDAVRSFGPLVFQAFHFQRNGRNVIELEEDHTRALFSAHQPIGPWTFKAPAPAGYLQLPRHLLWAHVTEDVPAEPADGIFWTLVGDAASAMEDSAVALLLVLGLREDRPGFTVVDALATPPQPPGHWGDAPAREEGGDFANILPGGELSELHGIVTVAELFKLVSRAFHALPDGSGSS
jgi:hypothetical protein